MIMIDTKECHDQIHMTMWQLAKFRVREKFKD